MIVPRRTDCLIRQRFMVDCGFGFGWVMDAKGNDGKLQVEMLEIDTKFEIDDILLDSRTRMYVCMYMYAG